MSSTSFCEPVTAGPVPLEALSTRSRRPRRVMYPASRSRRPQGGEEASDPACRWLLLLSLLVFLQIYTEEAHTCTELQNQCSEPAMCCPQEAEGSQGEPIRSSGRESWRHQAADRRSEHPLQCVVA